MTEKGFSLIELMTFIVLLSSVLMIASQLNRYIDSLSTQTLVQQQLIRTARIFLEEIQLLDFSDKECSHFCERLGVDDGEAPSDISSFDDIDDFHNFSNIHHGNILFEVSVIYSGDDFDIPKKDAKLIHVQASSISGVKQSVNLYSYKFAVRQ